MRDVSRAAAAVIAVAGVATLMLVARPGRLRAPGARVSAGFEPCVQSGLDGRVDCGLVRLHEAHDDSGSPMLDLRVVVARALSDEGAEPVFFFTGGPGSAASQSAGWLARDFAAARQTRDLVFIDQRGTGGSSPLQCDRAPGVARRIAPMFDRAETAACLAVLGRGRSLARFTTSDAARDVDQVRRALGYARVNVHGSSYGTRAAWTYAAMFPQTVRSMILHGPAPPGFRMPLPFSRGLDVALEGLVSDCESDASCRRRYPELRRDLQRTFDGVKGAPVRVTLENDEGGEVPATLPAGEVAEGLRYLLYTNTASRNIPSLLTQAAAGDYTPLARAAAEQRKLNETLNRGMYLSVTCAEDLPFIAEDDIRAETGGTRLGDYRVRQQQGACAGWPRGEGPPAAFFATLDTPALVLAGQYDPATPLAGAHRGMSLLPNGRLVAIPHGAHSFFGLGIDRCLTETMNAFIERGSAKDIDVRCVAAARRPAFY
jgi:pimeloyl-ACP methyl ester carboxylesterase